jgi:hypothetical protein
MPRRPATVLLPWPLIEMRIPVIVEPSGIEKPKPVAAMIAVVAVA